MSTQISPRVFAGADRMLRRVLLLDAATCLAAASIMLLGPGWLAPLTRLPTALLVWAGALLVPTAAFMAWTATRTTLSGAAVRLIVAGNVAWVVASAALIVGPWIAPNALGQAFVAGQALAVAVLTVLEHASLRRLTN